MQDNQKKESATITTKAFMEQLPTITDKKLVIMLGAILNEHKRRAEERREKEESAE